METFRIVANQVTNGYVEVEADDIQSAAREAEANPEDYTFVPAGETNVYFAPMTYAE